jgi:hypothetical protein
LGNYGVTERLAAFQEGLSSIEKYSGLLLEIQKSEEFDNPNTPVLFWIIEVALCDGDAGTIVM